MTAPFPNSSERDMESLRRAQRAHEPSMEEILASIRSIIDDREPPTLARAAPTPQVVHSKATGPNLRAVEFEPPTSQPEALENSAEPGESAPELIREAAINEDPLLSSASSESMSASFSELSAGLALQNAQMMESIAREMLRPMLKSWLDDNMPAMVERLVRAEIQRVARGGR